ncbi:MAG: MlaD family protein [Parvularculaceae bacterium]
METRAHYVLIGSFALAMIAGAFLFILVLDQVAADRDFDRFDIIFNDPVTGLSVGGSVRFNGIAIGEVEDLTLSPTNPNQVIARIRVRGGLPIKTDTIAQLEFAGVTGLSFIQLSGGSPDAPLLTDVRDGVPRIIATPSEFQRLFTGGGDIVESVNEALIGVISLLNEENIRNVQQIISDIRAVTSAFAENTEEIDSALTDFAELAAVLGDASGDLARLTASLSHIAEQGESLIGEDVDSLVAEARTTLAATDGLIREAQAILSENRAAFREFSENGLVEAGFAISEARSMIAALDRLARAIERDPSRFLFGRSYPEYLSSE